MASRYRRHRLTLYESHESPRATWFPTCAGYRASRTEYVSHAAAGAEQAAGRIAGAGHGWYAAQKLSPSTTMQIPGERPEIVTHHDALVQLQASAARAAPQYVGSVHRRSDLVRV